MAQHIRKTLKEVKQNDKKEKKPWKNNDCCSRGSFVQNT